MLHFNIRVYNLFHVNQIIKKINDKNLCCFNFFPSYVSRKTSLGTAKMLPTDQECHLHSENSSLQNFMKFS